MNPCLQLLCLLALEGAVIFAIAIQVQRFIQSAAWRRTLWHVCILSLLLLAIFEFTGVAREYAGWMAEVVRPAHTGKIASSQPIKVTFAPQPDGQPHQNLNSGESGLADSAVEKSSAIVLQPRRAAILPLPKGEGRGEGEGNVKIIPTAHITPNASPTVPISERAQTILSALWPALLVLLWLLGLIAVLSRIFIARVAFEIFRFRRRHVADQASQETLCYLAAKLGIRRRVRLLESDRICAPVAFGLLRPTIVLPAQFIKKFTIPQQHTILSHELAHLAGHDAAWYLLADFLTALLWWHPLVWRARYHLHAASELTADEASLLIANGPGVLAECLVEIGARLTQPRLFRAMSVEGNGFRSGLGRRVERLVKLEGKSWRPPNRFRGGMARVFGPLLLVTAVILCTAWVIPPALTKGDNMKTITKTWKQPLAALALLASFNTAPGVAQAGPADPRTAPTAALAPAASAAPRANAPLALAAAPENPAAAGVPGVLPSTEPATQAAPTPWGRVGAQNGGPFGQNNNFSRQPTLEQVAIQNELQSTVDGLGFDGLPLSEVLNNLVQLTSGKGKTPINFILSREQPPESEVGTIDPATGLPVVGGQPMDWSAVTVTINPALNHVRLIDVLEVIVKSTDKPIKYSIENYGVVFSRDTSRSANPPPAANYAPPQPPLDVRTFKVDTNTFLTGIEHTFDIHVGLSGGPFSAEYKARETTRAALTSLLKKLGVNMDNPDKSIFYNDVTGIVMMRATEQDLSVMSAAIETLGGSTMPTSSSAQAHLKRP